MGKVNSNITGKFSKTQTIRRFRVSRRLSVNENTFNLHLLGIYKFLYQETILWKRMPFPSYGFWRSLKLKGNISNENSLAYQKLGLVLLKYYGKNTLFPFYEHELKIGWLKKYTQFSDMRKSVPLYNYFFFFLSMENKWRVPYLSLSWIWRDLSCDERFDDLRMHKKRIPNKPFHDGGRYHKETSPLIGSANQ